ncbi:MAG: PIN domain-containing protein, partial [Clostridiales Family XIII bacterium]|nr:PIN domain-containing protein [Clostridiales Family XIII bacterium]
DTNIFAYLYSDAEPKKQEIAKRSINEYQRFVSTQVLNEFCNVCIRKLKFPISAVKDAVLQICETCNLVSVDDSTVQKALDLHERYGFSYYDSLMVVSALESDCKYLLSEDMANNQTIESNLIIKNIFI